MFLPSIQEAILKSNASDERLLSRVEAMIKAEATFFASHALVPSRKISEFYWEFINTHGKGGMDDFALVDREICGPLIRDLESRYPSCANGLPDRDAALRLIRVRLKGFLLYWDLRDFINDLL